MLRVTGLTKRFGAVRVLEGVNLQAQRGAIHAIVGENGAGKSTLIRILSGVTSCDSGAVDLDGTRVSLGRPSRAAAAGIHTAFQEFSNIPDLSVAANLLYGAEPSIAGLVLSRRLRGQAQELLSRFGLDRIDAGMLVAELSLGDRQILEVVRALRNKPNVLILDESTSALSSSDSDWVLQQARKCADYGAVVLLITHRMDEVRTVADHFTVLRGGKDVLSGIPADFADNELIVAMLGRRIDRLYPLRLPIGENVVLDVQRMQIGPRIGPIDFSVREGEILGLGGLQGQGQREVLMALGGAKSLTSGTVTVNNEPYKPALPRDALARRVAYVPEDRQKEGLFLTHNVTTNIVITSLGLLSRRGLLSPAREKAAAKQGAERVNVADWLCARVDTLSGGNQQKVVLAKAIQTNPTVLLLHDCTRGVDVGTKSEIFSLMSDLAARGTAIIFYSSDLSELAHLCDRVVVMAEGRLNGVLEHDQISEASILELSMGSSNLSLVS